ncbi:hypothetical protein [Stieleria varia]|nr:hypothetical protein [Stieleria varia]
MKLSRHQSAVQHRHNGFANAHTETLCLSMKVGEITEKEIWRYDAEIR